VPWDELAAEVLDLWQQTSDTLASLFTARPPAAEQAMPDRPEAAAGTEVPRGPASALDEAFRQEEESPAAPALPPAGTEEDFDLLSPVSAEGAVTGPGGPGVYPDAGDNRSGLLALAGFLAGAAGCVSPREHRRGQRYIPSL